MLIEWNEFWRLAWQQSHFGAIVDVIFLVYVAFAVPAKLIILIHGLWSARKVVKDEK